MWTPLFWGNKLTLGADWFRKETRDILLQLPVPNMMGVSAPMQNAGVVRNTGIELQLGHNNRINDWSYSIGANFSYVTTKIMDLKGGDTPGAIRRRPTVGILRLRMRRHLPKRRRDQESSYTEHGYSGSG